MSGTDPSVTIVITPRERFSMARESLESVAANTPGSHRLVCVAGGAPPDIREYLATACAASGHELIVRPEFLAPNVARNLGLARAKTEYVAFLDNDVIVEPGWLEALVRCAEEENADLVGPLVLIGDPKEGNLHSLGGTLVVENDGDGIRIRERHHFGPVCLRGSSKRLTRLPSDYSEFHCALVRRSVFDRIGPLDERIVGAAEHIDLALHLRALGCRGFAEPASVVSYMSAEYTIGDHATYSRRWSNAWFGPTMDHLASKWNLSPRSMLLADYRSNFQNHLERCLLRVELRTPGPSTGDPAPAQTIGQLLDQMETLGYDQDALLKVRDAHQVATELFAASFRSSGRTYLAHLVGTASVAALVGANPAVLAAALLHAAYRQAEFPVGSGDSVPAMRRWLRRRVGETTEALIFAFSHRRIEDVAEQVARKLDDMPIVHANATVIRIANTIEKRLTADHRHFDSRALLREGDDAVVRALPVFEAVAGGLGVSPLTNLLRRTLATTRVDGGESPLRPVRYEHYAIDPDTGARKRLPGRNILAGDAAEPSRPRPARERGWRRLLGLKRARIAIRFGAIKATNGGIVTRLPDCARIVADPIPWAYSASVDLGGRVNMTGSAVVAIRLQVDRGRIGVLLLERGHSMNQVANEHDVTAADGQVTIEFNVAAIEEAGELVFRGWPVDAPPTQVRVFAISVVPGGTAFDARERKPEP